MNVLIIFVHCTLHYYNNLTTYNEKPKIHFEFWLQNII